MCDEDDEFFETLLARSLGLILFLAQNQILRIKMVVVNSKTVVIPVPMMH